MKENLVFCRILFKGRVQGVGFRFTTRRIAETNNLCGFVRNLLSGEVEVEVEGERNGVESFLEELRQRMKFYITDLEVSWGKYQGKFSKFEITI